MNKSLCIDIKTYPHPASLSTMPLLHYLKSQFRLDRQSHQPLKSQQTHGGGLLQHSTPGIHTTARVDVLQ